MSGHNKWSTIKHTKAKNDAANAKVFSKILREMTVAVKEGGSDPNSNNRLKNVILKAKSANMPNDNISRTIKKASGELGSINYQDIVYEGYGPAGSAVIVEVLTDNKNRTASEIRHYFDKYGGNLGTTGNVSYLFNKVGEIIVLKGKGYSDDEIVSYALDAEADDVVIEDTYYKIVTTPANFDNVKNYLEKVNVSVEDAEINLVPDNYIDLSEDKLISFQKLISALEDNDDVQNVYHNVNLPEEEDEE